MRHHTTDPLAAANVVYDGLGSRLGFRRRYGTRELLTLFGSSMASTGQLDAHLLAQFSRRQQLELVRSISVHGIKQTGQHILTELRKPGARGLMFNGVLFDFWEEV